MKLNTTENEIDDIVESDPDIDADIGISELWKQQAYMFKEARDRLQVVPGIVGMLLGFFHIDTDDIFREENGNITVYHSKKIGKKIKAMIGEVGRDAIGVQITVMGCEQRPKIGGGRIHHSWQKRSSFRTLLHVGGPIRVSDLSKTARVTYLNPLKPEVVDDEDAD